MKKKFYWGIIILSWIFILSSCSQRKCEEDLGYQYPYRVEILDSTGYVIDVKFAYNYYRMYKDPFITFVVDYCSNGKLKTEHFYCKPENCIIIKL